MRNAPTSISGKTLDDTRFEARMQRRWAVIQRNPTRYRCVECDYKCSYAHYVAHVETCPECQGRLQAIRQVEPVEELPGPTFCQILKGEGPI